MKIPWLLHTELRGTQQWNVLILANLTSFVAVADQRSFRGAASRPGVTPSALSHSTRQPEERLGQRLLRHRSKESSSIILGTVRCGQVCARLLTCSAPPAAQRRPGVHARILLPRIGRSGADRCSQSRKSLRQLSLNARSMFSSASGGASCLVKSRFGRW
jgi:Bacterial regulatory helix-turn-helix protein, lysR family